MQVVDASFQYLLVPDNFKCRAGDRAILQDVANALDIDYSVAECNGRESASVQGSSLWLPLRCEVLPVNVMNLVFEQA